MSRPGRRVSFHLETLQIPAIPIEESVLYQAQIVVFPKTMGLYPLKQWDQLELYWGLWTMPTGATFVDLTLIGFRGFVQASGIEMEPAFTGTSVPQEFYTQVFTQLDTTNAIDIPFQDRIRKTAADPVISTTDLVHNYRAGTRHSFPVEEDFFGFLVQTDGSDITGSQTLWGILGSE